MVSCANHPEKTTGIEIWSFDQDDFGIYRKLNTGETEFLGCDAPGITTFKAMHDEDLKTLLGLSMQNCSCEEK